MTHDPYLYITVAVAGLTGLGMLTAASLSGWHSWLALKRQELIDRNAVDTRHNDGAPSAASRIEVADLKERIRKLEAIAAGVDL